MESRYMEQGAQADAAAYLRNQIAITTGYAFTGHVADVNELAAKMTIVKAQAEQAAAVEVETVMAAKQAEATRTARAQRADEENRIQAAAGAEAAQRVANEKAAAGRAEMEAQAEQAKTQATKRREQEELAARLSAAIDAAQRASEAEAALLALEAIAAAKAGNMAKAQEIMAAEAFIFASDSLCLLVNEMKGDVPATVASRFLNNFLYAIPNPEPTAAEIREALKACNIDAVTQQNLKKAILGDPKVGAQTIAAVNEVFAAKVEAAPQATAKARVPAPRFG